MDEAYEALTECSSVDDLFDTETGFVVKRYSQDSVLDGSFNQLVSYLGTALKNHNHTAIKGKLVELLVIDLLARDYNRSGCQVAMRHYVRIDSWRSTREVDALAWDKAVRGEFYECKFRVETHGEADLRSHIANLREIKRRIEQVLAGNCTIGFATFQDTSSAVDYLEVVLGKRDTSHLDCVLGREWLKSSSFPRRRAYCS